MKILFIASDTGALGGIQQYNRKFIDHLRKRGDDVTLVEIKSRGFFARLHFISEVFARSIIDRPDVTVCAHINYAPLGYFMKKLFGREYIVCTHGVDVWEIRGLLKQNSMREAKLITTVAEYTRDKIVGQVPELKDKIYFLYNSVDGSVFKPKEKSQKLIKRYGFEGKKVIFTIARISAEEGYKGYDRVIEAMPKILQEMPNAVYLLAGKGDDVPRIEKLVQGMGLETQVVVAGYVPEDEVVDHYNLADVFVMPSKAEGAPAVFLEALACGIPVIAGNQDGSRTPLQNGEVGLLIDPNSVNEIAGAIVRVLTNDVDARLFDRDFLRRKTLERFGIDRFPEKVDRLISMVQLTHCGKI